MTNTIKSILSDLKLGLQKIYTRRLIGIYLFGSYARGEEDNESDVDVMIVLNSFDRYGREIERTGVLVSDISLKYNLSISRVFIREQDWLTNDTPLLRNLRQEAIPA